MLRPDDGKGESGLQHDNLFSFLGIPAESGNVRLFGKIDYSMNQPERKNLIGIFEIGVHAI
jgi:hypothetical protein